MELGKFHEKNLFNSCESIKIANYTEERERVSTLIFFDFWSLKKISEMRFRQLFCN